jgi:hypothetical protein
MSAFIVSHKHIDALISAMLDARMFYWDGHNRVYVTRDNAEEVGRILLEENVRSVLYRYGGRIGDRPRPPVQIIKAVHCLDYQSCETEDWETTLAWRIFARRSQRPLLGGYPATRPRLGRSPIEPVR